MKNNKVIILFISLIFLIIRGTGTGTGNNDNGSSKNTFLSRLNKESKNCYGDFKFFNTLFTVEICAIKKNVERLRPTCTYVVYVVF